MIMCLAEKAGFYFCGGMCALCLLQHTAASEKALLDGSVYSKSVCGILGRMCMFGRRGCVDRWSVVTVCRGVDLTLVHRNKLGTRLSLNIQLLDSTSPHYGVTN